MNLLEDKENQAPLLLDLNFKKRQKVKSNTDRSSTLSNSNLKKQNIESNYSTISLLEKKKQYSESIRSKHQNSTAKTVKQQYYPCSDNKQMFELMNVTENENIQASDKIKTKIKAVNGSEEQIIKTKGNSTRDKIKNKKFNTTIENIQSYSITLHKKEDRENKQNKKEERIVKRQQKVPKKRGSMKMQYGSQTDKVLQIIPLLVNQIIEPEATEQMKQIQTLQKHNATYKKQLACFRKDNGNLKRQVQTYKKQMQELSQRNNFLINQNQDQIKLLQGFDMKVTPSIREQNMQPMRPRTSFPKNSLENNQDLDEIIKNYEKEVFQSGSKIKQLQFKNYMLEKKLLDESEYHRKIMAKEISNWKQKYIRARNENIRIKDTRNSQLFDMSISTEM